MSEQSFTDTIEALAARFARAIAIDDQCGSVDVNLGYVSVAQRDQLVSALRGVAQAPTDTSELRQLAVALRANTVKLRFFRGAVYDGFADEYLAQLTKFIDAVVPILGTASTDQA